MSDIALFDPGFAPLVYNFSDNITAIETILKSVKSPNQRRFKFQTLQPQIISLVKNNTAFYFGCLMWAKFLKEELKEQPIENNPFLGINLEEKNITEEDICADINNFISFFDKYKKDSKFYTGKESVLPERWLNIALAYKDFLSLNKSFVNTKLCSELILPPNIDELIKTENLANKKLIYELIRERQIENLLEE